MVVNRGLNQNERKILHNWLLRISFLTKVLGPREKIFFHIIHQHQYFSHTEQLLSPCTKWNQKTFANTYTFSLQLINATCRDFSIAVCDGFYWSYTEIITVTTYAFKHLFYLLSLLFFIVYAFQNSGTAAVLETWLDQVYHHAIIVSILNKTTACIFYTWRSLFSYWP